ncbi:protein of unknown function DUF305 [Kribbella flavida DSM 17836]|uniref:DUF305 domain-containing protein n=1 Tax=Kribbella flavida (strain DSM 17836 / JCM 10339 / NBRC 14399) TaxID=479435 RepID=D2PXF5_KRIFD|nr:DUF305 domain-containing protein [Kribbella flavida]ADB29803.1 protein of unknown function DUF305 [Kribbella flavida DSM 17836]
MRNFLLPPAAAVLCLSVLVGCRSSAPQTAAPAPAPSVPVIVPGTPGGPNRTLATLPSSAVTVDPDDLTFLADMMIHHSQALVMAERAKTAAADQRVRSLAERIRVGQKPEIEAMRQLLTERGGTPPPLEHVEHTDHGDMPGMATPAELARLLQATGKAFDTQFLTLMIKHHEGAVAMSGRVIEHGSDLRVGELAQDVGVTQTKEIATMRTLLKEL